MDPQKNTNRVLWLIIALLIIVLALGGVFIGLHLGGTPVPIPPTATSIPNPTSAATVAPTSVPPAPTATPSFPPSPLTPTPALVINLPLSSLDIVTDTPSSMQVKTSYTITVSLTPKGQARISDLMLEMARPTVSDTISVGTPGASLKDAFGPGFEPVAMATLQADTFAISPVGPVAEPLDQPEVTWEWSVTPNELGMQFLAVDIEGYWKAANGETQGPYRIGDKTFRVDVNAPPLVPTPTPTPEPFITPGHVDIGAILTSLPGILLSAGGLGTLLIVGLVSYLKRQDRKKKSPVPHSSRGRSSRKKPTH